MGQKYPKNVNNAENTHVQVLISSGIITVVWMKQFTNYSHAGE